MNGMLLPAGQLDSHHFDLGFTQRNEGMGGDQEFIILFLMLIKGMKKCSEVKTSLSNPIGGKILLNSIASGK